MSERAALLRTISAAPWDDLPRLVFADWLDEHGEPERAEFIRLEIDIDRILATHQSPTEEQLTRRRALGEWHSKWHAELPRIPGVTWGKKFRRGFPADVTVSSLSAFLKQVENPEFAQVPVDSVKVKAVSLDSLETFGQCEEVSRLQSLDFTGCWLGDNGIGWILTSPHLGRLTVLRLSRVGLTDTGAGLLAETPALRNLEVLEIEHNQITDVGAESIAVSRFLRKVISVRSAGNPLTGAGINGFPWLEWMVQLNRGAMKLGEMRAGESSL